MRKLITVLCAAALLLALGACGRTAPPVSEEPHVLCRAVFGSFAESRFLCSTVRAPAPTSM